MKKLKQGRTKIEFNHNNRANDALTKLNDFYRKKLWWLQQRKNLNGNEELRGANEIVEASLKAFDIFLNTN